MHRNLLPANTVDLHIHTAPDVVVRAVDDLTLARRGAQQGLGGAVFKYHFGETAARARLARLAVPGFHACGSIVLNSAVGGLNPDAVSATARLGDGALRIVWMPTRDAQNDRDQKGRAGAVVPVTEAGAVVPAALAIARLCADQGLVLASGHIAPCETLRLFQAAAGFGGTLLATHVTAGVTSFDDAALDAVLATGAMIEICARNLLLPAVLPVIDPAALARAVRVFNRAGADRIVLSSDLGDIRYPAPEDGLSAVCAALLQAGVQDSMLNTALVANPRRLAGADAV